jgi:hypothetical protein
VETALDAFLDRLAGGAASVVRVAAPKEQAPPAPSLD